MQITFVLSVHQNFNENYPMDLDEHPSDDEVVRAMETETPQNPTELEYMQTDGEEHCVYLL